MSKPLSIWERRAKLEKDRREKQAELMAEYDKTVYFPASRDLIKECEKGGHSFGSVHNNGLGWSWSICSKCHGRYDIQGPWPFDSLENAE